MGTRLKLAVALAVLLALGWGVREVVRAPRAKPRAAGTGRGGDGAVRENPSTGEGPASTGMRDPAAAAPPLDESTVDRDRDVFGHVVDESGAPVAGATVRLARYPYLRLDGFTLKVLERVEGEAVRTASDGSFRFPGERGEDYALVVSAEGFATIERRFCQAGGKVRIVLRRGVRLVFEALDSGGRPVAGLRVSHFKTVDGFSRDGSGAYVFPDGVTGEDGRYVCEGAFSNGRIAVLAWHPNFALPDVPPFELPQEGEHVVRIELFGGRVIQGRVTDAATGDPLAGARVAPFPFLDVKAVTTGADGGFVYLAWPKGDRGDGWGQLFAIREGYALGQQAVGARARIDFALEAGRRLVGRLVDRGGQPVAGAFVHVIGRAGSEIESRDTHSGEDGRFVFPALRPDLPRTLLVLAKGFARHRSLVDGEAEDLGDIVLDPGLRLEGRISPADEYVNVRLRGPSAGRYGTTTFRRTDDLGRFRFVDLAPGSYQLGIKTPDGLVNLDKLELDADRLDYVLRLAGDRDLVVRVLTRDGKPVEDALVVVGPKRKRTDRAGVARIPYEGPHRFALLVKSPHDELMDSDTLQRTADDSPVAVILEHAAVISGRVELEGKPLARAGLTGRVGERGLWAMTDAEGRFRMKVPRGATVDLALTGQVGEALQPVHGTLRGVAAGSVDVVVAARRLVFDRKLRVRVTTPDGEGLPGISVDYLPRFQREAGWTLPASDARGRVELSGLPDVEVTVMAWRDARGDAWKKWCAPESVRVLPEGQEIELAFRPGVPIEGVVLLPGGRPAKVIVAAYGRDPSPIAQTASDEQGRFALLIPADAPEPVRVEVDPAHSTELAGAGLAAARVADVRPGTRDLRIVLEKE